MADTPIYFVGPLPPPVHGFAEINRRMLLTLRRRHQVVAFDMAPHSLRFSFLFALGRFLLCVLSRKPAAVYLAVSGGHRQWIDFGFVLIARLRGVPIFAHHHSFSYLSQRRLSATALFRALGDATHIVLCTCMGEKLTKEYGIEPANLRVLSNAAFLEAIDVAVRETAKPVPLRVGFLSNITAEKGIFEFFDVLCAASGLGLRLQGVVAGPVHPSVEDSFISSLRANANVEHVGAVYGADKDKFFATIDVLFFPTRYANEAEPVTVLEALGHGVPVIAFSRGCIESMVPASAGAVFSYSGAFVEQVTEALRPLAESPEQLARARQAASQSFAAMRISSSAALDGLMDEIVMRKRMSA